MQSTSGHVADPEWCQEPALRGQFLMAAELEPWRSSRGRIRVQALVAVWTSLRLRGQKKLIKRMGRNFHVERSFFGLLLFRNGKLYDLFSKLAPNTNIFCYWLSARIYFPQSLYTPHTSILGQDPQHYCSLSTACYGASSWATSFSKLQPRKTISYVLTNIFWQLVYWIAHIIFVCCAISNADGLA